MGLVERAKNIILTPNTEWDRIATEATPPAQLVTGYVLPLAAIGAVAGFIGTSLVGLGGLRISIGWGLASLVWHLVAAVASVFILGLVIEALAPSFGAHKDRNQALKLAAYSYTPSWVASILLIVPLLGILALLAALYGIYLLYLGLPKLMRNPPEKSAGYTAVVVVCAIVVSFILSFVASLVIAPAVTLGAAGRTSAITVDRDSPAGKLEALGRKMEEAGKRMDAAQKSGDPGKQMEAAMGALGTAMSGGKGVEPLQVDQLKPFVPETFAGLPRTGNRAERGGVPGLMTAKAAATYADTAGAKNVQLEVVDTGGAAGFMALAGWANFTGEREENGRVERTRKEGSRMVHEENDKASNESKYTVVLAERYVVSAEGNGIELAMLKSAVDGLDLSRLESLK